jgi:hypothetical protein
MAVSVLHQDWPTASILLTFSLLQGYMGVRSLTGVNEGHLFGWWRLRIVDNDRRVGEEDLVPIWSYGMLFLHRHEGT